MAPLSKDKKIEYASMGALLAVTIVWGWGFVFSKMALDADLGPAGVMAGRFTLAAVLLGLVFFRTIRREIKKGDWKKGFVIGLILFVAFFTQIIGLEYTTPSNNAFITGAYVVFVPFIWWIVTKKRPRLILFIASIVSLAGVAVLSLNVQGGISVSPGDALTLLASCLFACQIVATGILARSIHFIVLVWMQMVVAAAFSCASLAGSLLLARQFPGNAFITGLARISGFTQPNGIIAVLFLGIFSTSLCYFLQTMAQRHVASAKAGIIMGFEALFGAIFSVMAGLETFTTRMVVGGLIMTFSIFLPELPDLLRRKKSPAPPESG